VVGVTVVVVTAAVVVVVAAAVVVVVGAVVAAGAIVVVTAPSVDVLAVEPPRLPHEASTRPHATAHATTARRPLEEPRVMTIRSIIAPDQGWKKGPPSLGPILTA
jgi:hypothetical protein